jgi:hypothetical protein
MFASKSLLTHLARGVVGLAAFACATSLAPHQPWAALAALAVAVFALRGCPSCWLLGLAETMVLGRTSAGACLDASCATRPLTKR